MLYKIRCLVGFSDFSILSFVVKQGQELTVSENVYKRLIGSGGKFHIIETITPPPVYVEPIVEKEVEKEVKRVKPKA